MKIDLIAGARPNFVKLAPLVDAILQYRKQGCDLDYRIVHTGQHYDLEMSQSFFDELNIPKPDVNLDVRSGTQAEQTGAVMAGYEKLLTDEKPDLCVVFGDINSTMAAAITAKKMHLDVAHVEAGLRSGDLEMPEEVNRIVTDSISDLFFTTSRSASENLKGAGVDESRIFFVGNTMIDTLLKHQKSLRPPTDPKLRDLEPDSYLVLTMHRPKNVDDATLLASTLKTILVCCPDHKVVFPAHPRTAKALDKIGIEDSRLIASPPLGYLEFNYLVSQSAAVITDSGGITEETTRMGIPCLTLRDSTERPETVEIGTNELAGTRPETITPMLKKLVSGKWKKGAIPELWDGRAAERIVGHIVEFYGL